MKTGAHTTLCLVLCLLEAGVLCKQSTADKREVKCASHAASAGLFSHASL